MTGAGRRPAGAVAAAATATVRARENTLVLPAADGYDLELVWQAAESLARRHGASTLGLGDMRIELFCNTAVWASPCMQCRRPVRLIAYRIGRHLLCAACARKKVGSSEGHAASWRFGVAPSRRSDDRKGK